MKIFTLFALVAFAVGMCNAEAADLSIGWTPPDTREDGTAIESLDSYKLYYSVDNTAQPVITINGDATSFDIMDISAGFYTIQMAAVESGQEGALSDPFTITIGEVQAARPGKVVITVDLINIGDSNLEVKQ